MIEKKTSYQAKMRLVYRKRTIEDHQKSCKYEFKQVSHLSLFIKLSQAQDYAYNLAALTKKITYCLGCYEIPLFKVILKLSTIIIKQKNCKKSYLMTLKKAVNDELKNQVLIKKLWTLVKMKKERKNI